MIDRLPNQNRGLFATVANGVVRLGTAAFVAAGLAGVGARPEKASADINEPVRYQQGDGRWVADAPLRTRGRAVLFYGPDGLGACGVNWDGPTLLIAKANEDNMNLKVTGKPGVFVDPIEVGGDDYASRAAAAVTALNEKAVQLPTGTRRIGVLTTRDAVEQTVCDLITDSGPLQSLRTLTAVLPDLILRCGQSVPLSFAIAELKAVGYPGPYDTGSVQAAENRTVNCGGSIRPAEAVAGDCDPLAITTLPARPDAMIDRKPLPLPVRDKNFGCERALWLKETGVGRGENFNVNLPAGWSAVVSPTTVAVHREGGLQNDFINGDVVIVNGPFVGGIGAYEGWVGFLPSEWAVKVANERLAIQRLQTGRSNAQVVTFAG